MGGTNGSGPALGALLAEALAEEERRLAALEARLAALRGNKGAPAAASDSTQAIWAALAVPASEPAPAEAEPVDAAPEDDGDGDEAGAAPAWEERDEDDDAEQRAADDAEQRAADDADWAALSGVETPAASGPAERPGVDEAYAAAAAGVDEAYAAAAAAVDDPRLEAARRLLAESGEGLQQLKACLSRAPVWDDRDAPADEGEPFWSEAAGDDEVVAAERDEAHDDDDDPPPPVPARERASGPRPRDVEASRFGLERAFRGDTAAASDHEPAWARALRDDHARGLDALARVEELLVELGKTIAAVLERSAAVPRPEPRGRELEERAARAERERDDLRRVVAERSQRIARLEALVEQVMASPGPAVAPPPPLVQPVVTPRGTRRPPAAPSEALRRTLLASPEASNAASRRALEALRPIADDDRARLRAALVQIGARHQQLVEEHAALLDRLVKLLER